MFWKCWAWNDWVADLLCNTLTIIVVGKLTLASLAVTTLISWYSGLVEVLVYRVLLTVNLANLAVVLLSAFALPRWAAVAVLLDKLGFTGLAFVLRATSWGITGWAAEFLVTSTFVELTACVVWIGTLDVSPESEGSITEDEILGAVVVIALVSAFWLLASVGLASTVVTSTAYDLTGLAIWLGVTWSWDTVKLALAVLLDTLVDLTVMFPRFVSGVLDLTIVVTGAAWWWWCNGRRRCCIHAFISWAAASSLGRNELDLATELEAASNFLVSWLAVTSWTFALFMDAHAFVVLDLADLNALVGLVGLAVRTCVVFSVDLIVAAARGGIVEPES